MNIHIQCLSLLIILFTINPLSIAELIEFIKGNMGELQIDRFLKNLMCIYIISIVVVWFLAPESLNFNRFNENLWLIIGVVSAPMVILIEILVICIGLKMKKCNISRVEISSIWVNCSKKTMIYTVCIGVLEEVVYRQIWFYLLLHIMGVNIGITVLISSIFYSLNHITLGINVVIQKFISGIIFSLLFYYSGEALIVPVLCHGLQNLIVAIGGNISGNKS